MIESKYRDLYIAPSRRAGSLREINEAGKSGAGNARAIKNLLRFQIFFFSYLIGGTLRLGPESNIFRIYKLYDFIMGGLIYSYMILYIFYLIYLFDYLYIIFSQIKIRIRHLAYM